MKIKKAIIPVAGLGTRFFPATKAIAKEMLPIVDIPCVQFLVEEAVQSGIEEIIFIVSEDKPQIEKHFTEQTRLNELLKKSGKTRELAHLQDIENRAHFHFVIQDKPLGDGHAILCATDIIKDDDFAVLFGDDIYDSNPPALKQLIKIYEKHNSPVISLQKVSKSETHKYGIIDPKKSQDRLHEISKLVEKPSPAEAPSNLAITGKYIITNNLYKSLQQANSHTKDGELRIIDGMKKFVKSSPIYGYEIEGDHFDTGDKLGYLKAIIHFGLKNKTMGGELKKHLKDLDLK
ncbi:UTP--glucose-1-phosphate uridylyltransferase [Patescibacteria group bacterium]|nr:UTP--glucose-1-phosphate uridylyltransferase [Patescibacteria group bacterium]